ncbi:ABC transporter permease [Gracilibacillus thailandensis]|jgi:ABC-2 type transport system permease protein|uniref:Transport permease protein n=1 Tax=Gracilibacillus thailandensis TaxID=563735 RepID=A0A6N7R5M6_9BACI|nr:ABC transporter permease [Gracilibacillus thailandensis]MRI68561.1 ABC transporter permease subunit [Gracilibacillus thailandensis]
MWAITIVELKKKLQDKGIWFWTFILPIIFIVGFITIFSGMNEMEPEQLVTQIVPGYIIMFTFFIMISMVITFIKDRDSGMVARVASTPLPLNRFLVGKWLPFLIIVILQIIVLMLFGVLVYDLPLGDPLALTLISLILAFLATSWGMAMSLLVNTENMGIALTQVIALGGAMLGGLWMPLEIMPNSMQLIAKFLPQYWALEGFQSILQDGGHVMDIWLSLLILLGFGMIGCVISVISYPRFLRQSRS